MCRKKLNCQPALAMITIRLPPHQALQTCEADGGVHQNLGDLASACSLPAARQVPSEMPPAVVPLGVIAAPSNVSVDTGRATQPGCSRPMCTVTIQSCDRCVAMMHDHGLLIARLEFHTDAMSLKLITCVCTSQLLERLGRSGITIRDDYVHSPEWVALAYAGDLPPSGVRLKLHRCPWYRI